MIRPKSNAKTKRVLLSKAERQTIRVFLEVVRAECRKATERYKRAVVRSNGESFTNDLRYWSDAVKVLDYCYHRAGRRLLLDAVLLAEEAVSERGPVLTDTPV